MMKKKALLIGNGSFEDDQNIKNLNTPLPNVRKIKQVLTNNITCDFEDDDVSVLEDKDSRHLRIAITDFFSSANSDDLLLFYYCGHGEKIDLELFLLANDSRKKYLEETSIPAKSIGKKIAACKSKKILVILDCCYSGSFSSGEMGISGTKNAFQDNFRGRIVLTSSDKSQKSWEFESGIQEDVNSHSIFSRYLIEGLETGKADVNNDGKITSEDLFRFIREKIKLYHPEIFQHPRKFSSSVEDIVLALNPYLDKVPVSVIKELQSTDYLIRIAAVQKLQELLSNMNLEKEVVDLLEEIHQNEPDNRIVEKVNKILSSYKSRSNDSSEQDILHQYLSWLIEQHSKLILYGIPEARIPSVDLEQVYVALKVDKASTEEIVEESMLIEDEIMEYYYDEMGEGMLLTREQKEIIRSQILKRGRGVSRVWKNQSSEESFVSGDIVSLGEAFQNERWLVVLGDPGSGKTTLARWLALKLAKAYLNGEENVTVPKYQIDPNHPTNEDVFDLGVTRLPIIIRISDYADLYQKKLRDEDEILELVEYLGKLRWNKNYVTHDGKKLSSKKLKDLFLSHFRKDRAVVILDGMDEVVENRGEIVAQIQNFIETYINNCGNILPDRKVIFDYSNSKVGTPIQSGGNQVIVTSRIVGYQASPIKAKLSRVFIEPMRKTAVERFCHTWTNAVLREIHANQKNEKEIANLSLEEANKLIEAIYDENKPQIQKLASNPLLITIIALVFRQNKGTLPQQRAILYEIAMERLFQTWRKTELNLNQLKFIFAPLAYYMHDEEPSGMIEETDLKKIISKQLAIYHNIENPDSPPPNFDLIAEDFIKEVTENVGILASRTEKLFGFLHLTFQEYLAGIHLLTLNEVESASRRIIEKIGEPRWREAILLALSYLSINHTRTECERLMLEILEEENQKSSILLTNALILVSSFEDMDTKKVTIKVIKSIMLSLLSIYSNKKLIDQFPSLKAQIDRSFLTLQRVKNDKIFDKILIDIIDENIREEPEIVLSLATVLLDKEWLSERVVSKLFEFRNQDSHEWNFPIHTVLQQLISREPTPENLEELKQPIWTEDHEKLANINPIEYKKLKSRYEVAFRVYQEKKDQLFQIVEFDKIFSNIPFKGFLNNNSWCIKTIQERPYIHRLIVSQFGGYKNFNSKEVIKEYLDLAHFLQQSDQVREQIIDRNPDYYIGNWGFEDPIYNCAVYLDSQQNGKSDLVKKSPEFSVDNIFLESSLSEELIKLLKTKSTKEEIIEKLWSIYNTSPNIRNKTDALVGLLSVGVNIIPQLRVIKNNDALLYRTTIQKMQIVRHSLNDPIIRGKQRILEQLAENDKNETWFDVTNVVLRTIFQSSQSPIDLASLRKELPEHLTSAFEADRWFHSLIGSSDDITYAFAVVLDSLPKGDRLLNALYNVKDAPHVAFSSSITNFRWSTERFPPIYEDYKNNIDFLDFIDGFEGFVRLNPKHQYTLRAGFKSQIISNLKDVVESNALILPELLVYCFQNNLWESINELAPIELLSSLTPEQHLLTMIFDLDSPFFKCSALLRFLRFLVSGRKEILKKISEECEMIENPLSKSRILEKLILYLRGDEQLKSLESLEVSVDLIEDKPNKALAYLRVADLSTTRRERLIEKSAKTILRIEDDRIKAKLIKSIINNLSPNEVGDFEKISFAIKNDWLKHLAVNQLSFEMLKQQEQLIPISIESSDIWTPVLLGSSINDVLDNLEGRNNGEVVRLFEEIIYSKNRSSNNSFHSLLDRGQENGIKLTRDIANYTQRIRTDHYYNRLYSEILISLLEKPAADAVPILENWLLQTKDILLRDFSALALAETSKTVNQKYIDGICNLLEHSNDKLRYRAELILTNGINKVTIEERVFKASQIGKAAIERAAQHRMEAKNNLYKRRILSLFLYHIIHDAPSFIKEWYQDIITDSPLRYKALEIFNNISECTEEAWEEIEKIYSEGDQKTQEALSDSFLWLNYNQNKQAFTPKNVLNLLQMGYISNDKKYLDRNWVILLDTANDVVKGKINFLSLEENLSNDIIYLSQIKTNQKIDFQSIMDFRCHFDGRYIEKKHLHEVMLDFQPNSFKLLVSWLSITLQQDVKDSPKTYTLCSALLDLVALLAGHAPSIFTRLCKEFNLENLILQAAQQQENLVGRRAATELLAYLPRKSSEVINVLISALKDDHHIYSAAMKVIKNISFIDHEIIKNIYSLLEDESANVNYLGIQMLSLIGKNENIQPKIRSEILTKLTKHLSEPASKKAIYEIVGEGSSENPHVIQFVDRLDKIIYRAMLEISGAV